MTTFALIPGAGADQWYWSRLTPLLAQRGHEALARSCRSATPTRAGTPTPTRSPAAIGDRTGVVIVAQSMGAFTAPLLCSRVDVARIALLCPMIPAPGDTGNDWWEAAGQATSARAAAEREGRDPDAPFDLETTFLHDVPAEVRPSCCHGRPPRRPTARSRSPGRWTRGRMSRPRCWPAPATASSRSTSSSAWRASA